jgi:hypothetical protein
MDLNGCKDIFSVDVYPYTCSELECPHEGKKFSLLRRSPNWQQASLNDSVQSHHHIPGKAYAILDKAAAVCEIFNVWIANRLIG